MNNIIKRFSDICIATFIVFYIISILADHDILPIDKTLCRYLSHAAFMISLIGHFLRFIWFRRKNGDFRFGNIESSDYCLTAHTGFNSIEIRDSISNETLFRYSLGKTEKNGFGGVCWEPGSHDLWIRLGNNTVFCLRRTDDTWIRDDTNFLPDTIALTYNR